MIRPFRGVLYLIQYPVGCYWIGPLLKYITKRFFFVLTLPVVTRV